MAADPNKYKQNAGIKPDTLSKTIKSVGSVLLMAIGIIGLALELFKDDGLFQRVLSIIFQSTTSLLLIPLIIAVFWLLNRWFSSSSKNETKKSGNIPMYIMMMIGIYYVVRIIRTGWF